MVRLYSPEEGDVLVGGLNLVPKNILDKLSKIYFSCQDKTEPTPTFAPALFQNILDHCKNIYKKNQPKNNTFISYLGIFCAVALGIPFYLRALENYREKRIAKALPLNLPLCFREVAGAKKIEEYCQDLPVDREFDILSYIMPEIDERGMVVLTKITPALKEDPALSPQRTLTPSFDAASKETISISPAVSQQNTVVSLPSCTK
jgi:hypothetical protein